MIRIVRLTLVCLFLLASWTKAFALSSDELIGQAKLFWDKYYQLEQEFNGAAADLYADDAYIKNVRRYPNGTEREMVIDAPKYKMLIRSSMGLAKARGDTNQYSQLTFAVENDRVRIKTVRYSNLKKYESPLELLVGPDKDGQWC